MTNIQSTYFDFASTVYGAFFIAVANDKLCKIGYPDQTEKAMIWVNRMAPKSVLLKGSNGVMEQIQEQIIEYTRGKRQNFDLPLQLIGTDFQKKVWKLLYEIPYGTTTTYKEIANAMGGAEYARAVGNAIARNPIPLVLPCHRVVGSNQKLTGYAGGIDLKSMLLLMERSTVK